MGEGFLYQYAGRASSPAFLLVTIWLMPTGSRANKVMAMELAVKALEVCDGRMIQGSAEPQ